jgi:hypothetical protein
MALAADGQDDLIQVAFVAPSRCPSAQGVGDIAAEFPPTLPDRLVIPRAASISSTMRRRSGKRKYSHTAVEMTSAG